jgi:hypothetical protein
MMSILSSFFFYQKKEPKYCDSCERVWTYKQGFGSVISGWIPIWIRIQGFYEQKLDKIYSWKKKFLDQKLQLNP